MHSIESEVARPAMAVWPPDGCGHDQELSQLRAQVQELRDGLQTRQLIGTAVGMLSIRFGCTTEQAFSLLTRVSQHTNVKLREIARVMVDAHNDVVRPDDVAMLARISAQLPGGWPRRPDRSR